MPWNQCQRYQSVWHEYTNTTEFKAIFEKNKLLISYLEEKSGGKFKTLRDLHDLYDRLFVGRLNNKWY